MTARKDGMAIPETDPGLVMRWDWKNLTGGGIQTVAGLALLYISMGYNFGSSVQMGPGYLPRVLSVIFIGLGLITMATARHALPTSNAADRTPANWRAPLCIFASILLFMLLIERAGFLVTLLVVTICARLADRDVTWKSTLIVAVITTALNVAIFIFGLQMPFKLWWW
ncbi:tripartite tricarboxylate transporter TctB family protein [Paracoccus thiocyanatus]|uniref:DUF1468 domain-containing protein n=1 Tax=Paracoccus thiocyanatus TaxID=34006 RepID=A0A3D8PCL0_9RHOB|nr:tripartite tricarboxylate transporter TctB family protein [Paracoccus thiocyanatus]RDW12899.1 hypothetical protein DIE28_11060 [Paracoccus thiocyanatus]